VKVAWVWFTLPKIQNWNVKSPSSFYRIILLKAAALNHPNISTIHAIEEANDELFIVMEYIEGQELKEKLKSGPLTIQESINIANQIGEGLHAANVIKI
jgi:serine/threonine protein kinase